VKPWRAVQVARYRLRKALGLCPECGERSGIDTFCARCLAYHRERMRQRRAVP
jgi:hypothetical protein